MLQESAQPDNPQIYSIERYPFNLKQYFRRGWDILKENAVLLIAYCAIALCVTAATGSIIFLIPTKLGLALTSLLMLVLLPPIWAGFFAGIFPMLRRERVGLKHFFQSFSAFPHLVIANLVAALLIFTGCFISLIFIPGLYLIIGYIFAAPLIIDRRLKFWQALETSRLTITQQWFRAFAFVLALLAINLGGALILGLGLFVTLPLSYCAIAAAYDDIIGLRR
ncbi:hypothetical protein [Oscillatoria sp. FACHB-1406]|uniref:hypothetical protein n=1 Tax=Oscillatoria sp. FACHB-1406 TaxID=2692846 RepID=UPI001682E2AA|nr:hypothetical protein [Oscillatoria sp. FACHB-1406]MBD2576281.1 hypothetical protein [Oscillatoria sp. FACHB-1406]